MNERLKTYINKKLSKIDEELFIEQIFKLNGRAPEGSILSVEEIEAIGYKFQLLIKIK